MVIYRMVRLCGWRLNMKFPEHYRKSDPLLGIYNTKAGDPCGVFTFKRHGEWIKVIATDGFDGEGEEVDWEHVSVSCINRCPTWGEMQYVKELFWEPGDCVIQYHPPEESYVNNHPFVLHMWRWKKGNFPMPPTICV